MKKFLVATGVVCAVIGLGLGSAALGNGRFKCLDPSMAVSPHTVVLSEISAVTVHTNIPKSSVDLSTVTLDYVEPMYMWADDCGHLAARFSVDELGLVPADAVTLTLRGTLNSGVTFAPEDVVRVK